MNKVARASSLWAGLASLPASQIDRQDACRPHSQDGRAPVARLVNKARELLACATFRGFFRAGRDWNWNVNAKDCLKRSMAETNRRKSSCSLGFFWEKKAKSKKFLRVTKFFH